MEQRVPKHVRAMARARQQLALLLIALAGGVWVVAPRAHEQAPSPRPDQALAPWLSSEAEPAGRSNSP